MLGTYCQACLLHIKVTQCYPITHSKGLFSNILLISGWKDALKHLPPPLCSAVNPKSWRTIYTCEQMEASLSKVSLVGFSEQKDIFGLLTVSPVSSGFCIGSSNWIISSGFEKVAYVSGSSTLTTHPRYIKVRILLLQVDRIR